jgi:thiosulfate/3-mercaptopyruvate sulfurtransferase
MTRLLTAAATATALAVLFPTATAEGPQDQPRTTALLSSFDDLQKRLNDPALRLLDARPRADHEKGHIPGAVWVDVNAARALAARPGGLTDKAAWEAWAAPLGIGPGAEVYVYDGDRQLEAARLWWLLAYLGVERVGLVNGNFPLWEKQGRPVSTEATKVDPRRFKVVFRDDRHATRSEVLEALKAGQTPIIDARSEPEYTGAEKRSKRGGHIPGGCLLEWSGLVDKDGRFLEGDALRARLSALGVKPGQPLITHCQSGGRASVDAFALERLGHPARNYYLGWSDWGNTDETPIEAGKEPNPNPKATGK